MLLDKIDTHQETGMLAFPLETMQFFSSGLIIVGLTFRTAWVFTIGRDLKGYKGDTINKDSISTLQDFLEKVSPH